MSGSGGGGGGFSDTQASCILKIKMPIISPQPAGVSKLKSGNILDVTVAQRGTQTVVEVLHKGELVGGLAGPDATRIRNCIETGYKYQAEVLSINGGQVRVEVVSV